MMDNQNQQMMSEISQQFTTTVSARKQKWSTQSLLALVQFWIGALITGVSFLILPLLLPHRFGFFIMQGMGYLFMAVGLVLICCSPRVSIRNTSVMSQIQADRMMVVEQGELIPMFKCETQIVDANEEQRSSSQDGPSDL